MLRAFSALLLVAALLTPVCSESPVIPATGTATGDLFTASRTPSMDVADRPVLRASAEESRRILHFSAGASSQAVDAARLAARYRELAGVTIRHASRGAFRGFAFSVTPERAEDVLARMEADPEIAWIAADRVVNL